MAFRKVGSIHRRVESGQVNEQEELLNSEFESQLKEAKTGKPKVYYGEASHILLVRYLSLMWFLSRLFFELLFLPSYSTYLYIIALLRKWISKFDYVLNLNFNSTLNFMLLLCKI